MRVAVVAVCMLVVVSHVNALAYYPYYHGKDAPQPKAMRDPEIAQ